MLECVDFPLEMPLEVLVAAGHAPPMLLRVQNDEIGLPICDVTRNGSKFIVQEVGRGHRADSAVDLGGCSLMRAEVQLALGDLNPARP